MIKKNFTDPRRVARLRAEVERLARRQAKGLDGDRRRLQAAVEELDGQIARGHENLARLPPDMIDGVVGQVRKWKEEREERLRELARLDAVSESAGQFTERVGKALDEIRELEENIATAPPTAVRNALAGIVKKVTLHFGEGKPLGGNRRRCVLESLDVELQPEVANLFGSGNSRCS
jgi:hypothetical protein